MRIVFDEIKRQSNIRKHGFDFADLDQGFFETARIVVAKHGRKNAVGGFGPYIVSVIFAQLGHEALSILSMRRASRQERRVHGEI